jgi:hypothetical protein
MHQCQKQDAYHRFSIDLTLPSMGKNQSADVKYNTLNIVSLSLLVLHFFGENQSANAEYNSLNNVSLPFLFLLFIGNEAKRQCKIHHA